MMGKSISALLHSLAVDPEKNPFLEMYFFLSLPSSCHPSAPVEPLSTFLTHLPFLTDEELYEISLEREPRGAELKDVK